jgi:hypothetical protein
MVLTRKQPYVGRKTIIVLVTDTSCKHVLLLMMCQENTLVHEVLMETTVLRMAAMRKIHLSLRYGLVMESNLP